MDPADKRKSVMSNKKRSFGSIVRTHRKSLTGRKKSIGPKMLTDEKEDSFIQWSELKEDIDTDNFIYGLHDEMAYKVLESLRERRLIDERIENFVESFCSAWLKLVKWRWMVKDDRGKDIIRNDEEPKTCPKDPWSSRSYGDPAEVKYRTSLPPPLKCCPHPSFQEPIEHTVEKPIIERVIRTLKKDETKRRVRESSVHSLKSKTRNTVSEPVALPHMAAIPKTAFPERISTKISMGPQVAERKKGALVDKPYTSEIDLTDSNDNIDRKPQNCQQFSRLDL